MGQQKYTPQQLQQVRDEYPLAKTPAEKQQLADSLGVGGVRKLYNLAAQLGVTRAVPKEPVVIYPSSPLPPQIPAATDTTPLDEQLLGGRSRPPLPEDS